MAVSHHHNIHTFLNSFPRESPETFLFAVVFLCCVGPACAGRAACQGHADVGVQPPVEPDGQPVSQEGFDKPISEIVLGESIAMVQIHTASLNVRLERCHMDLHPELFREEILYPTIVVPDQEFHRNAPIGKSLQCCKRAVKPLRYDSPVFEPEIK